MVRTGLDAQRIVCRQQGSEVPPSELLPGHGGPDNQVSWREWGLFLQPAWGYQLDTPDISFLQPEAGSSDEFRRLKDKGVFLLVLPVLQPLVFS